MKKVRGSNCLKNYLIGVFENSYGYSRGVVPGGAGGGMAPPDFGRSDRLTLSQPGGTDYVHLITNGTPGFSNLPTALHELYLGLTRSTRLKKPRGPKT